jgi:hypothetical protein
LIFKVFNPENFQDVPHKYAPSGIQIEVGNAPDKYEYKSRVFEVQQGTDNE